MDVLDFVSTTQNYVALWLEYGLEALQSKPKTDSMRYASKLLSLAQFVLCQTGFQGYMGM